MNINEIITDFRKIAMGGYLYRDGFVFVSGQEYPMVFNRLVIRVPWRARAYEDQLGYSNRSLEEHVQLMNKYQIKKVYVISDNLDFLLSCPFVEDIRVHPSYEAPDNFDYTVLYQMPNLKAVSCWTKYGAEDNYKTTIDYSRIKGVEKVAIIGKGHIGFEKVSTLKKIWLTDNKEIRDFSTLSCSDALEDVTFLKCGIQSLNGLEKQKNIKSLTFYNNRALKDISALEAVRGSLEELTIDSCSKICDFSVLDCLENLRFLQLSGNNAIPNLDFLKNMKKLLVINFSMNIESGDLSNCMSIPYATCKNRKHYNLKDKDLPKNIEPMRDYRNNS